MNTKQGWGTLARAAGVVQLLLLAFVAIALADLEAAGVALASAIGLLLLRWRSGLVGSIALALLFANMAFWSVPAALSNIGHAEGFWETALPSALTVFAVSGLIGSVGAIVSRRTPEAGTRGARAVVAVALAVLAAAVVASAVSTNGAVAAAGDLSVVGEQVKFEPDRLRANGGEVGVFVSNRDLFWHTFTIRELDVNVRVPVGAERRVTFEARPGTYEFVCLIPGHEQSGMKGTLTVR